MAGKLVFVNAFLLLEILLVVHGQAVGFSTNVKEYGDGIFQFKESREYVEMNEVNYPELKIFCYNGSAVSVLSFWSSVEMKLTIDSDDYHLYVGNNISMVQKMHEDHMSSWFYHVLPWKTQVIRINTFEPSCVGVLTRDSFKLSLLIKNIDYIYFLMTVGGILLFYYAKDLCRNVFFHYTTGVGVGICLSLVVMIYFIQRRFKFAYAYAMVSYSLATYIITTVWYNIKSYLMNHYTYVLAYLLLTGGVSFAACYRMGPVENPRSLNLIQWTLQFAALALIFCSSYHQAASLSVVLCMLLWESTPVKWKTKIQVQYQLKIKKAKPRLLTEQEYLDQTQVETQKALDQLRSYCKSPKCDAWKITSRLSSPSRFAEFVAGSPHVNQDEILNYSQVDDWDETDASPVVNGQPNPNPPMTDDDSSDDDSEIDLVNPYE